jgi:AraC family transcriptional regulator, alkane utilization regulator
VTDQDASIRDGLRSLLLSGSVFLRAHLSAPWAYESPSEADLSARLRSKGERIIIFHIITAGRCRIELSSGAGSADLQAGDIAIMPFCDQHKMGDPGIDGAVPLDRIMPDPMHTTTLEYGGGGAMMSMVCGYLRCDDVPLNPVLATLPPLIRVPTAGGPLGHWVEASIQYAMHTFAQQRSDDPLLQRLPELMFTECLCDFAKKPLAREQGWLAGLADPVVGRALACMHREPEHPWTLKELARRAATSRSVLDDRFRQLLKRAPMGYLTAFRLQLASRRLRTSSATMAEVAGAVGYASEAAFSRAFKRHVGVSPSEWRSAG